MDMEANMAILARKSAKIAFVAALAASCAASPAFAANKEITPYIELDQFLTADVKNGGDVLTYSAIAAGIDAQISTSNAELQVNYRYERRFDWQDKVNDQDVHTGLARARIDVVPDLLSFEAGALAARGRSDVRGGAAELGVGNVSNVTQVYSVYAGPSFATNVGPIEVAASYRAGYTKAEARDTVNLPVGSPRLDSYDDSVSHYATASVGMSPGVLPFGWTVSGGYERENAGQLSQRFEDKTVRGDVTLPITESIALVGGVGYEQLRSSQKSALVDATTGEAVVDSKGRFVTDVASARQLNYDFDGIYWDAGVLWRPSSRTSLEARVGKRYGSMTYYGSFNWQTGENSGLQASVYDEVETFGQQLNDSIALLPTSYRFARNNLRNNASGCVFGSTGGGCLNDALQSVNTSVYRSRGVGLAYTSTQGRWTTGVGAGYNQRKFFAPAVATGFTVNGLTDEDFYGQASIEYALSERASLAGDAYVSYYKPGESGAGNVLGTGATGSLYYNFSRRFSANASVGVAANKQEGFASDITVSALTGLRYSF
jgi:uncharacterized protein (PEP-CTERM system associated)